MPDNVVQLHPKRNEERQGEDVTRERLSEADNIREELRSTVRLSEPADKEKLARNLGRMVEDVAQQTNSHRLSIVRDLFAQENSDEAASSLLKKRKRYIRFSDETSVDPRTPGEFGAYGQQFISLAKAIAKLVPSDTPVEQRVQSAILKLAEGTTFDSQYAARSRITADGTQEYIARMEEVLSIVQKQVDLPRYFDAIAQTQLSPDYLEERAAHTELFQKFPDLMHEYTESLPTDAEDGEWRKMRASKAAPQVAIGHLYVPRPIRIAIPVVPNFEYSTEEIPLRKRLERALIARYGRGIAKDAVKKKYRSEFLEKYANAGKEMLDRISQLSPFWTKCAMWDRLDLVLSVERERSTEQAKLFLGCQFETDSENADPVNVIGETAENDRGNYGLGEPEPGSLIWNWLVPVAVPLTNCYILVGSPEEFDDPDEIFFRTLKVSGQKGLGLAFHKSIRPSQYREGIDAMRDFNYSGEWIFRPSIRDAPGNYVPVLTDSIAGAILRNLAYAPPEKRLDTLLVDDAKRKIAQIDGAIDAERKKYLDAISRLGEA